MPDWVGAGEVEWAAVSAVRGASRVSGCLRAGRDSIDCDLMAADMAYPQPLLPDEWRRQAHQAWVYGQVLMVAYDHRLTLAVPGTAYSADGALETIARLAKAVGAATSQFTVSLRL